MTLTAAIAKIYSDATKSQRDHMIDVLESMEKCGGPGGTMGPCPGGGRRDSAKPSGGSGKKPPKPDSREIVDAELVDEKPKPKPKPSGGGSGKKPTGHDPAKTTLKTNIDNTVRYVHEGRKPVKSGEAKTQLEDTGLALRKSKGGVEAHGHTQEQVVAAMKKKGWIAVKRIPDPDNPDFMLDVFEKGGKIATVHGQSEAARKEHGTGDASKLIPPHIVVSDD